MADPLTMDGPRVLEASAPVFSLGARLGLRVEIRE